MKEQLIQAIELADAGQWDEAVAELTKSTDLAGGGNAATYFLLAMAHWQLGNKDKAVDWYDKAMKRIEDRGHSWVGTLYRTAYDLYLDASELLGIKLKEIVYSNAPVGRIAYDDSNDTYTLQGAGEDIWKKADQFHYGHKTLKGDSSIAARIEGVEPVHEWTKVGVMIRDTNAPDSVFAAAFVTPENRVSFQYRLATLQFP